MFSYSAKIKMHHIDAAGSMFFGSYFQLVHDAYESFLEYLTFDAKYIFEGDMLIPIVHAEADYTNPVKLGDKLTIELAIENIGRSSFALSYNMLNQNCEPVAHIKTTHVTILRSTKKPISIPKEFRESLENLAHDEKGEQVF